MFVFLNVPIKLCVSFAVPFWVAACPSSQLIKSKLWCSSSNYSQMPNSSTTLGNISYKTYPITSVFLTSSLFRTTIISCLINSNGCSLYFTWSQFVFHPLYNMVFKDVKCYLLQTLQESLAAFNTKSQVQVRHLPAKLSVMPPSPADSRPYSSLSWSPAVLGHTHSSSGI